MKKILILSVFVLTSWLEAQPRIAPGYVRKFVASQLLFSWPDSMDCWRGGNQAPGRYIFWFQLDLDGDGVTEDFFALSIWGDDRNLAWKVFSKGKRIDDIELGLDSITYDAKNRAIIGLDSRNLEFIAIRLVNGTFKEEKFPFEVGDDGEVYQAAKRFAASKGYLFDVETDLQTMKLPLAYFIKHPEAPWRPVRSGLGILQQEQDPDDEVMQRDIVKTTFEEVMPILKAWKAEAESEAVSTTPAPQPDKIHPSLKKSDHTGWLSHLLSIPAPSLALGFGIILGSLTGLWWLMRKKA